MGVSQGIDGAVGLGVDIVDIARMKRILERTPSFARKVYSDEERALLPGQGDARSAFRHAVRREGGRGQGAGHRLFGRHRRARHRGATHVERPALRGAFRAREGSGARTGRARAAHLAFVHAHRGRGVRHGHHRGLRACRRRARESHGGAGAPVQGGARHAGRAGPASKPDGGPTSAAEAHGGPAAGAAGVAATEAVAANVAAMEMEAAAEAAAAEAAAERPAG